MAGSPSDRVLRQVHRLFNFGAVGTMSDAQLLDRFVARRDEAAEAAFEELVIRHGPMVLAGLPERSSRRARRGGCLSGRLPRSGQPGQVHPPVRVDCELAVRGRAARGASRARRSAARRRALDQLVASRTSESDLPAEIDPDWEILHDEIHGLARAASRPHRALLPARADLRCGGASARALGGGDPWPAGPGSSSGCAGG